MRGTMIFSILVITIAWLQGSLALSFEKRLTMELVKNYSTSARPLKNDSKPVEVTLGLTMNQLLDVDTNVGTMTGLYWFNLEWKDEYLVWDEAKNGGLKDLRLEADSIWLPDIEPFNMISIEYLRGQRESVVVRSDGGVTWIPPFKMISTCAIENTDAANCKLKFGSWTYNGFKLNISMQSSSADLGNYTPHPAWDIVSAAGRRNEVIYECCPEPYLDITYTIQLRKRERNLWEQEKSMISPFTPCTFTILSLLTVHCTSSSITTQTTMLCKPGQICNCMKPTLVQEW